MRVGLLGFLFSPGFLSPSSLCSSHNPCAPLNMYSLFLARALAHRTIALFCSFMCLHRFLFSIADITSLSSDTQSARAIMSTRSNDSSDDIVADNRPASTNSGEWSQQTIVDARNVLQTQHSSDFSQQSNEQRGDKGANFVRSLRRTPYGVSSCRLF